VLRAEIDALRDAGLVGPGRQVDVFVSPGGYILGEETALLECMEGHRGEPRNKPPFPGNYGLHGRPTLMNSVETFADVPVIVARGAQWWADQGIGESVGWKFFAVSGHVEHPDVYCVPMGTTVGALIEVAGGVSGGRSVGAVQPGGASSNFIGPDQLDLALDFASAAKAGTMLGSGALVVLAEGTDLLAASTNVLRFFRNESCGKCVPCRIGSAKAHEVLRGVVESGSTTLDDDQRDRILRLEEAMRKTSICGLGQVALGPVVSVLGLDKGGAAARDQPKPGGVEGQPDR
jgi:formate dehydrogenase beta subunit